VRFGIFYEHQLPRPWKPNDEQQLINDALDQVELADRIGLDYVWEVEHHFLEEYSHSSAPEVFLAAASQRTKRIRLGHGIVQLPPGFNHPARVAERIAMLDLVSGGRVEFGTGESSSQMELGGFGVDRELKREQWEEALDAITRMFVEEPFAGYDGKHVKMPQRNVVPKPVQKPHPPLWVACSRRDTILLAGKKGIGALSFSFVEPEEAKEWVDGYYAALASEEAVPAGFAVNPHVAVVLPFMCHQDEETAIERGIDGGHFFGYSLAHYYVFGRHLPGFTNVWKDFQEHRHEFGFAREIVQADEGPLGVKLLQAGLGSLRGAVGTPNQITDLLERYEAAGVDTVIFVSQAGRNQHEHICESLELFGKEVLPQFAEQAERQDAKRLERVADMSNAAMLRRQPARPADPTYLVTPEGEPNPAPSTAAGVSPPTIKDLLRQKGQERFIRFLKGKNDRQLERILGNRFALARIFRAMEKQFEPARAAGFQGQIQYVLTTGKGEFPWAIDVHDGRATVTPTRATEPAVTLTLSVPTFARMLDGDVEPGRAWMEGLVQIDGDLAVAARLGDMFGRSRF
jgi:alkanesulfonate monooxygenase SsuD/methylene tetrahydromethanopterin reductase-like flavin-dependent oxidoreductase (luciferase family)/putative sterol carrier protein